MSRDTRGSISTFDPAPCYTGGIEFFTFFQIRRKRKSLKVVTRFIVGKPIVQFIISASREQSRPSHFRRLRSLADGLVRLATHREHSSREST